MAEIKPFKAWKYNHFLREKLYDLTAPLSETKFRQKQAALYQEPFHNFHIASPSDVPPYENVARRVQNWKLDRVIEQDPLQGLYVYYQYFRLPQQPEELCRKGFISLVQTCEWAAKVILPHEKTFSQAVEYRTNVLKHAELMTTPTHGLYFAPQEVLEAYMDEAMQAPLYEVTDPDGTRHVLGVIHDRQVIALFAQTLADKSIIIADGHHRYTASLNHKRWHRHHNPNHQGDEPYNYHLMWLSNAAQGDPGILATHRLIQGLPYFEQGRVLARLAKYFDLEPLPSHEAIFDITYTEPWNFGLVFEAQAYYLRLKPSAFDNEAQNPAWALPLPLKRLDISVMHHFIIEKVLGLEGTQKFEHLDFAQYSGDCIARVKRREAQIAILTHPIPLTQIAQVCESGHLMPEKSTYFFPKVLSGLVFADG
jgi:uncharacterized protein (DUF1015 family)